MGLSQYLKPISKAPAAPSSAPMASPAPVRSGAAFLKARATAAFEADHPEEASEIKRVINLITHYTLTREELEAVCQQELHANVFEGGWRLHPEQAALLLAYDENSKDTTTPFGVGCFGPIGCGRGKTLASQMLAERGFRRGIERSVILIPASVSAQFFEPDLRWARTKVPLRVFFHRLNGIDSENRRALIRSRKPGCYVLSYELLSQPEQTEILEQIAPGLIICDEAHNLARRTSSRTKRYLRYVEEAQPQCIAFSGTMTGKSVKDYWHIIKACLRLRSPLPVAKNLMEEWAQVLDSDAVPTRAQQLKLRPLVEWARRAYPKVLFTEDVAGYRKSFTLRLNTAPGVVSSPEDIVGASLIIENKPVQSPEQVEGWTALQEHVQRIEDEWKTPSGDELEHAIHCYKWLYELSAGFYNELFWPEPAVLAKRRGIAETSAKDLLDRARKQHAGEQLFARELRVWLQEFARPKLDSPLLVRGYMASHGAPEHGEEMYRAWKVAKALRFDGMPERDSRAVRVCPFKINAAAEWAHALKGEGGIVWIWNEEIGSWVVEVLRESGLDVFHAPAGDPINEELKFTPENVAKHGHQVVVASIKAHGTGKNLQWFANQYTLQWPRSAKLAEQMIARLHREGQKRDEITVSTSNTTTFDHANFAACLNDALYIHQTGGGRQRLIYARYDPLPKIYPPEWLRERGFQAQMLNAAQKQAMQEKFGQSFGAA